MSGDPRDVVLGMHRATAWNVYGTFAGDSPRVVPDRLRVEHVARPPSVRAFADGPVPIERMEAIVRAVYARDADGRAPTPSAGGLDTVRLRLADTVTGAIRHVRGGALVPAGHVACEALRRMFYERIEGAAWLVLLSGDLGPACERYGARAYRFALLEAGHIGEALLRAAHLDALAGCPLGAFDDRSFETLVASDRGLELPLYALALGLPRRQEPT